MIATVSLINIHHDTELKYLGGGADHQFLSSELRA